MANVKELERAVKNLSPEDYEEFRIWFERYESESWDNQFVEDVNSGKLDSLAKEAADEYKSGNCTEL